MLGAEGFEAGVATLKNDPFGPGARKIGDHANAPDLIAYDPIIINSL
jgi:hypothetical protein